MTTIQEVDNLIAAERKKRADERYARSKETLPGFKDGRPIKTVSIKQIALMAERSEIRIRQLMAEPDSPEPVRLGKQYGTVGHGDKSGRTPDQYDEDEVKIWIDRRIRKVQPKGIDTDLMKQVMGVFSEPRRPHVAKLADELKRKHPDWSDERCSSEAKAYYVRNDHDGSNT